MFTDSIYLIDDIYEDRFINCAKIKEVDFIVDKDYFIDVLKSFKDNDLLCYKSLYYGSMIKENDEYVLYTHFGVKVFSSKSLAPNDWLESIDSNNVNKYD